VAKYSLILARELNQSEEEIEKLRVSALLHDVGKIGVDDRILKKPGKLTDEEFDQMKEHPAKGANIMRPVAQLKDMIPGIELHHERIDGQGYPYGLKDADIPMMARIIAVADAVDAITTDRPYHSGHDLEYALKEIRNLTGKRYAIEVVDALEAAMRAGRFKLAAKAVELVSAPVGSPTA
jgi:HD-GYP domain-containing protein (c-di-GMP phosphodiesterase class II)